MADNQSWRISLGLSAVGVVGALLGSVLGYSLDLHRERRSAFEQRQNEAYIAFLNAFDEFRVAEAEKAAGHEKEAADLDRKYELEAGAAVRKIAIYGDKRVVKALAGWYRMDPRLYPCDKQSTNELATWEAMRESLWGGERNVSPSDFTAVAGHCRSGENQ
jgi:hypothetical protein